jgi:fibronectin-binding autotransporter adhesin
MNRLYKALLTVGLTVFSLDCLPAATVTWTDGAGDNLWSSTANWSTNAEPTSADTVVLGSAASGTIFVDTSNPPISNPNVAIQSLNFTNTNGALILNPFFNENFQLSGDTGGNLITNTSGFVQTISLPVFLTGSGVVAGGTGLNIGTLDTAANTITTTGNVAVTSGITFTIASSSTFGTINATSGAINFTGANINVLATPYSGVAGDIFQFSNNGFAGANIGSLATLNAGLVFVDTDLISQGFLYVDGNIISSGQTLTVNNDNSGSPNSFAVDGGVFLDGGELISTNNGGASFGTGRRITLNRGENSTIAAAAGTIADYSGVIADQGGSGTVGTLTIGDAMNTGTVEFTQDDRYTGVTTITANSTLQLGNGSTAGVFDSSSVVDNGHLVLSLGFDAPDVTPVSGTGSLEQRGPGVLTIMVAGNSYSGGTLVTGGTLMIGGAGVTLGATTGSLLVDGATLDLNGVNETVGTTTLTTGTVTTSTGTPTLTTSGVTVNGAGNLIDTGVTITGAITQAAGSTLTVSGTAGADSLANGATTLTGAGTVGAVTLNGGGNTITGNGTLTTGGVTVNGTNNTLTGTVVGNATIAASSALADNGALTGNVTLGTGTLSGTGSVSGTTGVTGGTVDGNGLTLTGLTTFNGAGNTLSGTDTATGGINLAAGAAVAESGVQTGTVNLTNGATTLSGSGTVGAVTLNGGGNTITGNGTLTTGGVTVNGTNNTLTGTVAGNETINAAAALADNGILNGNVTLGTGTLSGTGSVSGTTGVTGGTVNGNGLTLTGLTTFNGAGNTLGGTDTATGGINLASGATVAESGVQTGTVNLTNGATTLSGSGTVGAVTLNGGGNTITGNGTLTTGGVTVNGTNNTLTGTVNGAITQNASSVLAVNGTGGSDALANLAALNGTGTVTTVTLAGNNTLSSSGTLHTTSISVSGTGNVISSGTVAGSTTINSGGVLTDNATMTGSLLVSNGGTFGGTGTAGATTVAGNGAINLENNAIGTLTVGGLSVGTAGTPSILSFDLQTGGTNTVDKIQDNGTLTLTGAGGTTINVNALGAGALNNGSYVLIAATGSVTGNISDVSLSTTTLDGKSLSLTLVGGNLDLVVADPTVPVGTTYNLSTTAGATRIMSGQSTTLTSTITNTGTGQADTLDFTGLGATGTTVTGATTGGGPLANGGGAASNTGQTFSDTTAGAHTVDPTVATATNPNVGGNATLGSSTGTTIDVLNNRTVNTTTVALGRVLVNQNSGTLTTTFSSATNEDDSLTRITLGAGAQSVTVANGTITIGAGTGYQFGGANDATNSTTRGVSGSFTTTGNQAGTATVAVTGEGLTGEADNAVTVSYTADAVAKRTIANGASTDLGVLHSGDTVTGTSSAFTTTGLNATTTSVSVAAGSGTADGNGVTLNGAATTFDGSTLNQSGTRTFGGTLTSATGGAVTGTFNLAVSTLENSGAGLTGEGTYNPVAVAYSGFVYTGQGVYTAAGSSSWGTVSATPTNWTANGGVPGLDPNFVSTDSATFGNSIGATAATVTLDNDSPSLKAVTFDNTQGGSYTIAQGTGGTLKLNSGAGTATIANAAGNNTISAPIELDSNTAASVAGGDTLTLSGNISDVGGKSLTVSGPGTTILSGANSFSGGTTLSSGTLDANSTTSLGSGPLTVGGGTLDLDGLGHTVGAVDITGASTIQNGTLTGTSYTDSAAGGTTTISAALTGAGALTKTGGDTLALNGANSYTGGTTISAGTVAVGNATALGDGNVTFSGGTLETGNGDHQINVNGNYTQTGGTLVLNLTGLNAGQSPGYEDLHVTGTADLGGALRVNVSSPYVSNVGDTFTFVQAGAITGGFTSVSTNLFSLSITVQGAGVIIAQVPIATLPGVTYSPNEAAVATYVDNSFRGGASSPGFVTLLTSLDNVINSGNPQEVTGALDQLTPEKFSNFARTTVFNNAIFSTQLFDSFLESQRSERGDFVMGNGQIDSSGLSIVGPDMDAGLGQVESHMLAWSPAPLAHGLLSDTVDPVTAGLDMKQMKPEVTNDKNSIFNAFVLGNVVLAQGFSQQDVAHSNSTTGAVTVGGSFRITPHLRVGALIAYGHTDADLDTLGSKATLDSYAPGVFASYADNGWYANALASYGFNSFTEDRNVSFGGLTGTAHGAPTGSQIVGNLDGGYDFHLKNWTFGPTTGVQYTHLTVDGYSEDGLDPVDLTVGRQETDSLRSRLGGHVSYVFQTGKVLLTPHLDASWQHEFMDQSRGITSQFNTVGVGSFTVQTPNPSRDSALIDAGLNAQLNGQVTLYLDYVVQAGQDNYFGQAVQAGVKIGF